MWIVDWLVARWDRVWYVLDYYYPQVKNVTMTWYGQAKWVLSDGYSYVTDVAYHWRGKIRNVTQTWYEQARWVLSTGYSLITDVAYHWRGKIRNVTQTWYDRISNLANGWYDGLQNLWTHRLDLIYLASTIISRIKSVFSTSWWDDLAGFLSNPGAFLWAYIIELAEDKLEELLDKYW